MNLYCLRCTLEGERRRPASTIMGGDALCHLCAKARHEAQQEAREARVKALADIIEEFKQ